MIPGSDRYHCCVVPCRAGGDPDQVADGDHGDPAAQDEELDGGPQPAAAVRDPDGRAVGGRRDPAGVAVAAAASRERQGGCC